MDYALVFLEVCARSLLSPLNSIESVSNLNEEIGKSSCHNGIDLSLRCHHTSQSAAGCAAVLADALQTVFIVNGLFSGVQTESHLMRR
jgi:hypothetical protein